MAARILFCGTLVVLAALTPPGSCGVAAQALCPAGWQPNGPATCVLQRPAECPEGFALKRTGDGFTCAVVKPMRTQPECKPGDRTTDNGRYCLGAGGRYSRSCRPGFNLTDTLTGQECRTRTSTDPSCPPDSAFVPASGECRGVRAAAR